MFFKMFSSCFLLSDIKHVFYSHIDVFYNYGLGKSSQMTYLTWSGAAFCLSIVMVDIKFAVCLFVCTQWIWLKFYTGTEEVCPERCAFHFGSDRSRSPSRGAKNVPCGRYCIVLILALMSHTDFEEITFSFGYFGYFWPVFGCFAEVPMVTWRPRCCRRAQRMIRVLTGFHSAAWSTSYLKGAYLSCIR